MNFGGTAQPPCSVVPGSATEPDYQLGDLAAEGISSGGMVIYTSHSSSLEELHEESLGPTTSLTPPDLSLSLAGRVSSGLSSVVSSAMGKRFSRMSFSSQLTDDHFEATEADLMDNDCAEAMQRSRSRSLGENHLHDSFHAAFNQIAQDAKAVNDWSKVNNRSRLREVCRFITHLFWAFEDEDQSRKSELGFTPKEASWLFKVVQWLLKREAFAVFFLLLTIYALFGPDLAGMMGYTAAHNGSLASINTVVLGLFSLECGLMSWATPRYFLSGYFWADVFATLTIIGDTWIANELIESDAAVAGRGSRIARLVRVGGRSTRVVRIMRVARVAQVVRLVPMLQRLMSQSTKELAMLLMHKRLWHVFRSLDTTLSGKISDQELDIFYTALHLEMRRAEARMVQDKKLKRIRRPSTSSSGKSSRFENSLEHALDCSRQMLAEKAANGTSHENTFISVVSTLMAKHCRIGKVVLQRCVDDIECMKESCALLQTAISQLTLKICCVVMAILIALPVLDWNSVLDRSREQGLAMQQNVNMRLTTLVNNQEVLDVSTFCSSVNDYSHLENSGTAILKLLVVNSRVYISAVDRIMCGVQAPAVVGRLIDYAEGVMNRLDLQPQEMQLLCYPESYCNGEVRSLALWDVSQEMFADSLASLIYTMVVCMMMISLVVYFAITMKRSSNRNLFHPLWDLLDDMCALKAMEVIAAGTQGYQDAPTADSMKKYRQDRCPMCRENSENADEIIQLREAFNHLKNAILSWGKYVPTILLKQLYEAGIEASIGCSRLDVTLYFCDIANFQELSEGKKPQEVLQLLGNVLESIHAVIEEHSGTLLEFIGDEVLAVYSAPAKVLDHTKMAVKAAIEIVEKSRNLHPRPKLQSSVHRASVLAGNLGSPTRMKYGVMGDGVNLTARLKSLNSRYGTQLLVTTEALAFEDSEQLLVTRPIGKLVLKGRTTPTPTFEVLAKRQNAPARVFEGASMHIEAFDLFCQQSFKAAKLLFQEVNDTMPALVDGDGGGDKPSQHMLRLCEQYMREPPGPHFDGREHLTKKAW